MGSLPNDFSTSLRSWPASSTSDSTSIANLIQRLNAERGGFRNVFEDDLRKEIAEAEAGTGAAEQDGSSDEEDEEEEPDRKKDLETAKAEMQAQLHAAHQAAQYSLDFVSLLLSKDAPVQATLSLTPWVKDMAGTGTLGMDKIQASRVTDAQKEDNKRVAKGWKIQSLNKTVDTILESATRLEKEMETETKYWEQVLAVSEHGWAVCRLPNEKHTLGVRFGFSESAPTFKNQSLAALRRNPDGTISLDQGVSSTEPQSVRVQISVDDVVTGSSTISKPAAVDAPIETLILQARDTIFSTELWHELNRESRILGAFGVKAKGDILTIPFSENKTVIIDLVPLGDSAAPAPGADDAIAEGLYLSLKILLSYAHRQNHRLRTRIPPPISPTKRPNPPYSILRALITRFNHQKTVISVHRLLGPLCAVLKSASLSPAPSYTITHSASQPPQYANPSLAERTISSLTDGLESIATLKLTPDTTLTIIFRTQQALAGSSFVVSLNPESELNTTCPPHTGLPGLTSMEQLEKYIFFATSCALASLYTSPDPEDSGWVQTPHPNILRKLYPGGKAKQLVFDVSRIKTGNKGVKGNCMLTVAWEWMRHDVWDAADEKKHSELTALGNRRKEQGSYEWRHVAAWDDGDGQGEVVKPLDSVVKDADKIEGLR